MKNLKDQIQLRAVELGFDECRCTSALAPASGPRLHDWLTQGRHGEMHYLARNAAKRVDPQLVLPGVRSVLTLAVSYHEGGAARAASPEHQPATPAAGSSSAGVIARYARRSDYHDVLAGPLRQLTAFAAELGGPATRSLWYVDTGPVLERDLAQRAGIGFVGKHTNLISRRLGNWFLLAEILTTLELEPDAAEKNRCGSCTRCLAACPTQAITAPFELDARRCISYLTIELKGSIPVEFRPRIGRRIFGCDDCLEVCPWNRFAVSSRLLSATHRPDLAALDLLELLSLDDTAFKARFAGTPLLRAKRRGLLRNVCVALGNTGGSEALPALSKAATDPEPLIAEHARWAIDTIEHRPVERGK